MNLEPVDSSWEWHFDDLQGVLKWKTAGSAEIALKPFLKPLNPEACDRGGYLSHRSHTKTAAPLFLQKDI